MGIIGNGLHVGIMVYNYMWIIRWNTFNCTMSIQEKTQRLKLTPLPMPKLAVPILMSLDDEILLKEIKKRVKENDVGSIVFRDKVDSINAN